MKSLFAVPFGTILDTSILLGPFGSIASSSYGGVGHSCVDVVRSRSLSHHSHIWVQSSCLLRPVYDGITWPHFRNMICIV